MVPEISICMPCYGRPQRTRRMLECLNAQTMSNFELLLIGDGCPDFQQMIQSDWFFSWEKRFLKKKNKLVYCNLQVNHNDYGAEALNIGIWQAKGRYFCFANNDDIVAAEHIEFYCKAMKNLSRVDPDFVYTKTLINSPRGFFERDPELRFGCVGHSELIIKTELLRKMPPYEPTYGHDWKMVENMMVVSRCYKKAINIPFPTYYVMSVPDFRETDID
jgi:glycosyltransferase involved in cell wall biosynthesis